MRLLFFDEVVVIFQNGITDYQWFTSSCIKFVTGVRRLAEQVWPSARQECGHVDRRDQCRSQTSGQGEDKIKKIKCSVTREPRLLTDLSSLVAGYINTEV